ncbi:MAG TPA: hypothetical protein VMT17_17600 [Anaeromyxobacteraceae bacterium]|nr:hypothetical protein [Anaeromyxobacteraceae bacterium]
MLKPLALIAFALGLEGAFLLHAVVAPTPAPAAQRRAPSPPIEWTRARAAPPSGAAALGGEVVAGPTEDGGTGPSPRHPGSAGG